MAEETAGARSSQDLAVLADRVSGIADLRHRFQAEAGEEDTDVADAR